MILLLPEINTPAAKTKYNKLLLQAKKNKFSVIEVSSTVPLKQYKDVPGIVYGPSYFCNFVLENVGWSFEQNSIDWMSALDNKYLKRSCKFMKYEDIKKYLNLEHKAKVIRSHTDTDYEIDCICHTVEDLERDLKWDDGDNFYYMEDSVDWSSKFTCLIKNKKLVAYIKNRGVSGGSTQPDDFIKMLLEEVNCASSFFLTVGEIPDRGWAIIKDAPITNPEYVDYFSPEVLLDALSTPFAYTMTN